MLGALFLSTALEAVEGKNTAFRHVFVTNLIGAVVDSIPIIVCIFYWWTVLIRHETSWASAIVAWLIAWLIPALMISILFFLFLLPGFIPLWAL
jgi:riboflavin transporter FmnP